MTDRRARVVRGALAAGVAGTLIVAAALFVDPAAAVRACLVAGVLSVGLSLGAMLMLMVGALSGGAWTGPVGVPLTAMAAALPLGLLATAVPLASLDAMLPWRAEPALLPDLAQRKLAYFDGAFLIARAIAYALAWLAVLRFAVLRRGGPSARPAVAALVVYALTLNFFATDWIMAVDPRFYSSILPMTEAAGQATAALAAAILALYGSGYLGRREEAAAGVLVAEDLANLLFGLLLLWAYLAYMQWLVVWSGDLPPEIGWYLDRSAGIWGFVAAAIVLLNVGAIAGLLSRRVKRAPRGLALAAGAVLLGHGLHAWWQIAPSYPGPGAADLLVTAAAVAGLGGFWLAAALRLAAQRAAAEGYAHA